MGDRLNNIRLGLSIDFGATTIKCAIMDQYGNSIVNYDLNTIYGDIYKNLDNIYNEYKTIIEKNNIDDSIVEGYAIGIPGPIKDNKVLYLINVGIKEPIDIISYLDKLFHKKGYLINDADACGIGEFLLRNNNSNKCLIMMGTGTGIYIKEFNEELSHKIILDYDEKRYDNQGILNSIECYCSQIGIKQTYKKYCEKYNITYKNISIKEIFNRDNKAKIDTIEEFINNHLVDTIIIITNKYKINEIILGGGISNGIDASLLEEKVNKKTKNPILITKAIHTNSLYGLNRLLFNSINVN